MAGIAIEQGAVTGLVGGQPYQCRCWYLKSTFAEGVQHAQGLGKGGQHGRIIAKHQFDVLLAHGYPCAIQAIGLLAQLPHQPV